MAAELLDKLKSFAASRFARDAIYLQIGSAVTMVGGIATSILTFRLFGAEGYGRYAEALNLYTLLYFFGNVGFASLTVARVSEGMGRLDPGAVTAALGLFVKAYSLLALSLAAVGWILCPWLGIVVSQDREVGVWAAALTLTGALSIPFYTVQCALQGTRRMRFLAEMENLKEIVRVVCVVSGALAIGDPRGAILGELAGNALSIPIAWASYGKAYRDPGMQLPSGRPLLRQAILTPFGEVWEASKVGFLLSVNKNLTALMPTVVPRLLLSHFGSARDVGYLNLAQNLMKVPLIGFQGVSRTILPVLGQLRGSGDLGRLRRFLVKVMLLSGAAMIVLSSSAWLLLHFFIPFFYGEAARPAVKLLPWLFVAMVIAGFAVGSEGFFLVVKRVHVSVAIGLVFVAISIPFGFWMVSAGHAEGAAAFIALVHGCAAANIGYVFYYFRATRRGR